MRTPTYVLTQTSSPQNAESVTSTCKTKYLELMFALS